MMIILSYVIWPDTRSLVRKLIVFLSIADFLVATSNAVGTLHKSNSSDIVCKAQSAVTTYSNLSSFFWTVIIATYIFISLVLQNSGLARKLVPLYHVIAWLVPVAIVVAAIWKNVLGWAKNEYTLRWCWISDDSSNQEMWMLLTGKGWEVSAYLVTLILYMTTKCYLWSDKRSHHRSFSTAPEAAIVRRIDRKMTFIPIVFICLRISGTIRFFLNETGHSHVANHPALVILQVFYIHSYHQPAQHIFC